MISPRLAPQVIGVGLLEAVPEDDIVGRRRSRRRRRRRHLRAARTACGTTAPSELVLGRFGWKANVATVEQQIAGAFHGDIGITSSLHPEQNCTDGQHGVRRGDRRRRPGAHRRPARRRDVLRPHARGAGDARCRLAGRASTGAALFDDVRAARPATPRRCTPATATSPRSPTRRSTRTPTCCCTTWAPGSPTVGPTSRRPARSGARRRCGASGSSTTSPAHAFLLHDGRAATIEEAILWHGGEGEDAATAFREAAGRGSTPVARLPGGAVSRRRPATAAAAALAILVVAAGCGDDPPSRADVLGDAGRRGGDSGFRVVRRRGERSHRAGRRVLRVGRRRGDRRRAGEHRGDTPAVVDHPGDLDRAGDGTAITGGRRLADPSRRHRGAHRALGAGRDHRRRHRQQRRCRHPRADGDALGADPRRRRPSCSATSGGATTCAPTPR